MDKSVQIAFVHISLVRIPLIDLIPIIQPYLRYGSSYRSLYCWGYSIEFHCYKMYMQCCKESKIYPLIGLLPLSDDVQGIIRAIYVDVVLYVCSCSNGSPYTSFEDFKRKKCTNPCTACNQFYLFPISTLLCLLWFDGKVYNSKILATPDTKIERRGNMQIHPIWMLIQGDKYLQPPK